MHEFGIVQEVVALVVSELDRLGNDRKLKSFTLKVGLLSGVSPEALRQAFELVYASTPRLDGARMEIIEPPPSLECNSCGHKAEVEMFVFSCPACGDGDVLLTGGRDLQLASLEIDD